MPKRVRKSPVKRPDKPPVAPLHYAWVPPVLAALVYGITLRNSFVFDDRMVVVLDERMGHLSQFFNVTLHELVVRYWSLLIDSVLWGENPVGFHLTNVLLHAAVGWLLYLYLKRLLQAFGAPRVALGALAGAALFVVHPMNTEAVDAVSHRKEMLAAMFLLLALLRSESDSRSWMRSLEVSAYLLLALLSKAPAIVFFPLLWATDFLRGRRDLKFYWIPTVVAAAYVASRFTGLSKAVTVSRYYQAFNPQMIDATGFERILTSIKTLGMYWWLGVWPWRPTMERFVPRATAASWEPWVVLVLAVAALAAAWRWRRRHPLVSLGLVWLVVTPLPTINIIPLNFLFSERYMYVPLLGLALPLAWMAAQSKRPGLTLGLLAAAVLTFGPLVVQRNLEWKDSSTLLEATVRDNPTSPRLNRFYAMELNRRGRHEEALKAADIAVRGMPKSPTNWYVYAQTLSANNRLEEASEAYKHAIDIALNPAAMWISNYGVSLALLGRVEEAQAAFARALKVSPDDPRVRLHYAQGLLMSPSTQYQAVDYMVSTLHEDPGDQSLWALLAETRLAQGDRLAAEEAARTGMRNGSSPVFAAYLQGLEQEARHQDAEAAETYRKVLAQSGRDPQLAARVERALHRVTD